MYQLTKIQATLELEGQRRASLRCLDSRGLAGSPMKLMELSSKKARKKQYHEELGRRAAEKVLLLEAATFNSLSETFHKQLQKVEISGPLTKPEISEAEGISVQIVQKTFDTAGANLELAKDARLTKCYERVQGYTPVFIPLK